MLVTVVVPAVKATAKIHTVKFGRALIGCFFAVEQFDAAVTVVCVGTLVAIIDRRAADHVDGLGRRHLEPILGQHHAGELCRAGLERTPCQKRTQAAEKASAALLHLLSHQSETFSIG